jgi:hypothetical protein
VTVQHWDGGGGSGGDGSLVMARQLRHLAAARWWQWQLVDSLAAAAQRWQWRRHYGSSGGGRRFLQLGAGNAAVAAWSWQQCNIVRAVAAATAEEESSLCISTSLQRRAANALRRS